MLMQARKEAGLTQEQLADRLEVRQAFISSYERGGRMLDVLELRQVCKALGIRFLDFMARLESDLEKLEETGSGKAS